MNLSKQSHNSSVASRGRFRNNSIEVNKSKAANNSINLKDSLEDAKTAATFSSTKMATQMTHDASHDHIYMERKEIHPLIQKYRSYDMNLHGITFNSKIDESDRYEVKMGEFAQVTSVSYHRIIKKYIQAFEIEAIRDGKLEERINELISEIVTVKFCPEIHAALLVSENKLILVDIEIDLRSRSSSSEYLGIDVYTLENTKILAADIGPYPKHTKLKLADEVFTYSNHTRAIL